MSTLRLRAEALVLKILESQAGDSSGGNLQFLQFRSERPTLKDTPALSQHPTADDECVKREPEPK